MTVAFINKSLLLLKQKQEFTSRGSLNTNCLSDRRCSLFIQVLPGLRWRRFSAVGAEEREGRFKP